MCEKNGDEYRRSDAARHRKRCGKQEEHKCPKGQFDTKIKGEMNYLIVKNNAQSNSKHSTVCLSGEQEFPSYYSLQRHRRQEYGTK